jgi:crotonobetainyl-CoA:carnitine CoA-transferase CaiB-like acyl-CoA transferase
VGRRRGQGARQAEVTASVAAMPTDRPDSDSAMPLAGTTVVDASTFVSGPLAGMILGDLGAEVLKVEPPGGDAFRRFGRTVEGAGIMFANVNRNKQSVVIDLKSPDGAARFEELIARADVLLSNWRPGVAEELGFDPTTVEQLNSRLVWCRVSGFGQDGPLAGSPAFDTVIQARTGLLFAQGGDESPEAVRGYVVDKLTAMFAVQGVLTALVERSSTGRGSVIDVSMLDAMAYFMGPDLLAERTRLEDRDRPSTVAQLSAVRCVETSDGWLLVSPVRGKQLKGLAEASGHAEWIEELKETTDPAERTTRIYELFASVARSETTSWWLDRLEKFDVPAAPVLTLDEHLQDGQVEHNGTYVEYDHPRLGRIRQPRYPARWLGRDAPPAPTAAPDVGESERGLTEKH